LAALTHAVPASQIVFGSDFSFVTEPMLEGEISGLETSAFFDAAMPKTIDRDNALSLFPRFAHTRHETTPRSRPVPSISGWFRGREQGRWTKTRKSC